jgi:hypothetical protein
LSRKPRRRARAPLTRRHEPLHQMMRAVLLFLIDSGLTRAELGALVDSALAHAYLQRSDAARLREHSSAVSGLLFAWHRDPRCVDAQARPRPLRLRGAEDSIERLALEHCGWGEVGAVLEALRSQRLIRPDGRGRWLPSGPVATFRAYGPQLSGYVGETILNLMNTIQSNLELAAAGGDRGVEPLIERAALVRDLPPSLAAHFRSHVLEQGTAFLANIDDWLERHRARSRRMRSGAAGRRHQSRAALRRDLTAGVHVFAFIGASRRTPPRARRSAAT